MNNARTYKDGSTWGIINSDQLNQAIKNDEALTFNDFTTKKTYVVKANFIQETILKKNRKPSDNNYGEYYTFPMDFALSLQTNSGVPTMVAPVSPSLVDLFPPFAYKPTAMEYLRMYIYEEVGTNYKKSTVKSYLKGYKTSVNSETVRELAREFIEAGLAEDAAQRILHVISK